MRTFAWAFVGWLTLAPLASAAEAPDLSITIYNSNLALVEDVRSLDIKSGTSRLEFKGVSSAIRPETVALSAPGVSVIEQNFDFDLLSPDKLMEKAVGSDVRIVRINPGTGKETMETARVMAANNGVVLKIGDRIEILRDDGAPTRVIFDKVPDNLRASPTLSVTVASDRSGERRAALSYLTSGLSWKADYVAIYDESKSALDLQGWITLTNESGTTFADAKTRLVAGAVSNGDDGADSAEAGGRSSGATEGGGAGASGDYYLYPLAERTTIAQNQTKQVAFLQANQVKTRKAYEYRADAFRSLAQAAHADSILSFTSAKAGGVGAALPAGTVRVYVRDKDGAPRFIGENAIDHTPQGAQIAIKTGESFDVTVLPTLMSENTQDKTHTRYVMRYLVRNARDEPVTVDISQGGLMRDGKVVSETLPSQRVDANTLAYHVPTPAHGETTLTFTVSSGA